MGEKKPEKKILEEKYLEIKSWKKHVWTKYVEKTGEEKPFGLFLLEFLVRTKILGYSTWKLCFGPNK